MKDFAKKDVPFCNYVHEKLAELVTNAKQVSSILVIIIIRENNYNFQFYHVFSQNKIREVIHLK